MPAPDQEAVLKALTDVIQLGRNVGLHKIVRPLERFQSEFQSSKPTLKALRNQVDPVIERAYTAIRQHVLDECLLDPRPGMEKHAKEMNRAFVAMNNLIYPLEPQMRQMNISGFAGSQYVEEKMVSYEGDCSGVRPIVERSIVLIRRYSDALGSGDFEAAYALTDSGLRARMSSRKFIGVHEWAAREFHGQAMEFRIDAFNYVYADATARKKSNTSVEGWPTGTPKENRRGAVGGFWIRDRAAETGCGGTLWIAEEGGDYRIAKFDFWIP